MTEGHSLFSEAQTIGDLISVVDGRMCNLLSKAQQVRRQLKTALRQLLVQARLGRLLLRFEQVRCLAAHQ
jgi:hypothetical protein